MHSIKKKTQNDFAVFILTHGRSGHVVTYKTLKRHGYTGKIYLLVDDTDKQIDEYKDRYGNQVIIFDKQKAIDDTDSLDNLGLTNSVVFARNYSFIIAKQLGLKYFVELDDDYAHFLYTINNDGKYLTAHKPIINLDQTFGMVLDFLIDSGASAVCFSQSGDFMGGPKSSIAELGRVGKWSRKSMNSFFLCADRPFKFMGRINEDVNAYVAYGNIGKLFFTIPRLRLVQRTSQAHKGGLTDIYLDIGTYVKSFYSVMVAPSCVSVSKMGVTNKRLHHHIEWKYAVPKILSEECRN